MRYQSQRMPSSQRIKAAAVLKAGTGDTWQCSKAASSKLGLRSRRNWNRFIILSIITSFDH